MKKKEYEKPSIEFVDFRMNDIIMGDTELGGDGMDMSGTVEDWG